MVNARGASGIPGAVLAHQGGWDEILLVVGPIAIVAGLLWLARRRVTRHPSGSSTGDPHETLGRTKHSDG